MKNINEEAEKLSHEEKSLSQNNNRQNTDKIELSTNVPQEQNKQYHINMNNNMNHMN